MRCNYFGLRGLVDSRQFDCCFTQEDLPVEDSELKHLVTLVYAPDERTGLPSSDLSVLVSDSVPPQIADWVRNQLLRPSSSPVSSIKNGQQIDDDTLLQLTRERYESNNAYIDRVNSLLKSWNVNNEGD